MKQLLLLALTGRRGMTVTEAARLLGVSRQDASVTLRRARRRVDEARLTIEAFLAATAPVVRAPREAAAEEVAERLLREADAAGVKLAPGRGELVAMIRAYMAASGDGEVCIAVAPEGIPQPLDCTVLDRVERLLESLARGGG